MTVSVHKLLSHWLFPTAGFPERELLSQRAEATIARLSLEQRGLQNAPLLGFHLNSFIYYLCDFEGYVTSCSSSVEWG